MFSDEYFLSAVISRQAGIKTIQITKPRTLHRQVMDQMFQIAEKTNPVTPSGGDVMKIHVGGDAAKQILADDFRIVFQVLGEVHGVFSANRAGSFVIVDAVNMPEAAVAAHTMFIKVMMGTGDKG